MLDFPNGCLVGVAKSTGAGHSLNPASDYVIQADEDLLVLAEDDKLDAFRTRQTEAARAMSAQLK